MGCLQKIVLQIYIDMCEDNRPYSTYSSLSNAIFFTTLFKTLLNDQ